MVIGEPVPPENSYQLNSLKISMIAFNVCKMLIAGNKAGRNENHCHLIACFCFNLAAYPPIDAVGDRSTATPIERKSEVGSPTYHRT